MHHINFELPVSCLPSLTHTGPIRAGINIVYFWINTLTHKTVPDTWQMLNKCLNEGKVEMTYLVVMDTNIDHV